jgi:CRP-like cAMP-binding protein/anti-sigma regulatory factor (Ser/Thr protein kinase)
MTDRPPALDETLIRAAPRALPHLSKFAEKLLSTVSESGTVIRLNTGRVLFSQGDPGDRLYTVLSGQLRIYKRLEDDSEIELRRPGPGEFLGELALIDGGARCETAEALTPCQLFALSREAFLAALPRSPGLLSTVLDNLVDHVRTTTEHLLRAELEQRALRTEMELEKFRALAQMVAGVAHEINTPIGIVNTAASVIRQRIGSIAASAPEAAGLAEFGDVREAVDLMTANIQRAHRLIASFKQLAASHCVDPREALSLVALVEDVLGLFAINARRARLDIRVVNGLDDGATWIGYRGILTQILLNLLTNAERYAYPGGGGGPVEIRLAETTGTCEAVFVMSVRDFGGGIPAEEVKRVFEPFYTTGRDKGGTGLGLAIVQNLVTARLKGTVDLVSRLNEGTAVTLIFPKTVPE